MTALTSWELCVKYALFIFNFVFWVSLNTGDEIFKAPAARVYSFAHRNKSSSLKFEPGKMKMYFCVMWFVFNRDEPRSVLF